MAKKIFITYPYFLPAYKAGGPIQSIANLCRQMSGEYEFYVVCSNRDMYETDPLKGIVADQWNEFEKGIARVYYVSATGGSRRVIRRLLGEVKPDCVFVNGIYSPAFSMAPLFGFTGKRILSARGMLHPGALSQKSLKKRLFIRFLKLSGMPRRLLFHATDLQEERYIRSVFGPEARVVVAQNFSNHKLSAVPAAKQPGHVKLVSVALISPMKNHALVLQALKNVSANVEYDIYGPVKDEAYWKECMQLMQQLPDHIRVSYKGSLDPGQVPSVVQQYHGFVLPSKSENFGHALYESLSLGVPVITSRFTPWNNLEAEQAGWNVDLDQPSALTEAISQLASFDDARQGLWHRGATRKAATAIDPEQVKTQYRQLFG